MRTQKVSIQKYVDSEAEGKPIGFIGTLEEVKEKLIHFHCRHRDYPGVTIKKVAKELTWTENRDKHKKLGMGIQIVCDNPINDISYGTFWPVKLEKPKHIK